MPQFLGGFMNKKVTFVPPVGEVIRDENGKALLRLHPVIATMRMRNFWACLVVINYQDPENPDATGKTTEQIGFDTDDSRKLGTPNYLCISCPSPFVYFKFTSYEYGKRITFKEGDAGQEVPLDEHSCAVINYLIDACHSETMSRN